MNLSFFAPFVDCTNAMDWEIQQVVFDTVRDDPDAEEYTRKSPYVCISRNFEFPGAANIQWHDGNDNENGDSIRSTALELDRIFIILGKEGTIEITFHLNDRQFEELERYLRNMLGRLLKKQ
ncbi:MAG: hypothetical protein ACOYM3_14935 [Terrimicrobiaceae bacterium]